MLDFFLHTLSADLQFRGSAQFLVTLPVSSWQANPDGLAWPRWFPLNEIPFSSKFPLFSSRQIYGRLVNNAQQTSSAPYEYDRNIIPLYGVTDL